MSNYEHIADIAFESVTRDYDKLDAIVKIYEEAFPEVERQESIEGFLKVSEATGEVGIVAAVEGEKVVGFLVVMSKTEYVYGFFLAVSNELRSQGYGSRIMKALLHHAAEKTVLFDIETPVEGAPNYEQRVRRAAFYERLGILNSEIELEFEGDSYTVYCSKKDENLKKYLKDFVETCLELKRKFGGSVSSDEMRKTEAVLKAIE